MKVTSGLDVLEFFPINEGSIDFIYGRIGNGKTLLATIDIKRRLARGEVVYCNWKIDVDNVDQTRNRFYVLLHALGLKRNLVRIDCKKNLHYLPVDDEYAQKQGYEDFTDWLSRLTDCAVYLDEGHIIFDSYQHAKFSLRKRTAVLHTRHFNRSIVVVSQRPTAIHVSARANVNRFFKCERPLAGLQKRLGLLFFVKTEYQDMLNETVDEEKPLASTWYFPSRKLLKSYDTKYMRGGLESSQVPAIDIIRLGFLEGIYRVFVGFSPRKQSNNMAKTNNNGFRNNIHADTARDSFGSSGVRRLSSFKGQGQINHSI